MCGVLEMRVLQEEHTKSQHRGALEDATLSMWLPECSQQGQCSRAYASVRHEKKGRAYGKRDPRTNRAAQKPRKSKCAALCEEKQQLWQHAGPHGVHNVQHDAEKSRASGRLDNDRVATAKPPVRRVSSGDAGFELQHGGARVRGGRPPWEGDGTFSEVHELSVR